MDDESFEIDELPCGSRHRHFEAAVIEVAVFFSP